VVKDYYVILGVGEDAKKVPGTFRGAGHFLMIL